MNILFPAYCGVAEKKPEAPIFNLPFVTSPTIDQLHNYLPARQEASAQVSVIPEEDHASATLAPKIQKELKFS